MGTVTPNPRDFPDPHVWATWISNRSPQFKTHSSLGIAKNAISAREGYRNGMNADCYVYRWCDEGWWEEVHHLPRGSNKKDHPLFQKVVPRKRAIKGPSPKAVDAAIASIMSATEEVDSE